MERKVTPKKLYTLLREIENIQFPDTSAYLWREFITKFNCFIIDIKFDKFLATSKTSFRTSIGDMNLERMKILFREKDIPFFDYLHLDTNIYSYLEYIVKKYKSDIKIETHIEYSERITYTTQIENYPNILDRGKWNNRYISELAALIEFIHNLRKSETNG